MPKIHLVEGPVGAGKSTFVAKLRQQHAAPGLILDAWFVRLFSPDRPAEGLMKWYIERKERCMTQIWATALDVLDAGHDVVLELGLVERTSRERFYSLVQEAGHELIIYVLDAPRDVRRERVRKRNQEKGPTYAMDVPEAFFDMASDRWEPIDEIERELHDVRAVLQTE
jgi:predicted kinase